jgi:hypothetical protein
MTRSPKSKALSLQISTAGLPPLTDIFDQNSPDLRAPTNLALRKLVLRRVSDTLVENNFKKEKARQMAIKIEERLR